MSEKMNNWMDQCVNYGMHECLQNECFKSKWMND